MVEDRRVARFALGLGLAPESRAEPAFRLDSVVASTPEKERFCIVCGTDVEDGPSLLNLPVYRIEDYDPGAGNQLLHEQIQHPAVGTITYTLVRLDVSGEARGPTHPVRK